MPEETLKELVTDYFRKMGSMGSLRCEDLLDAVCDHAGEMKKVLGEIIRDKKQDLNLRYDAASLFIELLATKEWLIMQLENLRDKFKIDTDSGIGSCVADHYLEENFLRTNLCLLVNAAIFPRNVFITTLNHESILELIAKGTDNKKN